MHAHEDQPVVAVRVGGRGEDSSRTTRTSEVDAAL
jgi:hypothetical protein